MLYILEILSKNAKIVNCNQKYPFSQYKEFTNVLQTEWEV